MKKTLLVFLLCFAGAALAHHSPVVFDRTKEVKLIGSVTDFRWNNPHCWIELTVKNEKGETEAWSVEMGPPTTLVKAGWKSTTVKAGDAVTIQANPLRTNEKVGKFVSVILPGGKVLTEQAVKPAAPARN